MASLKVAGGRGSIWEATMAILNVPGGRGSIWEATMAILNVAGGRGSIWEATMASLNVAGGRRSIWEATMNGCAHAVGWLYMTLHYFSHLVGMQQCKTKLFWVLREIPSALWSQQWTADCWPPILDSAEMNGNGSPNQEPSFVMLQKHVNRYSERSKPINFCSWPPLWPLVLVPAHVHRKG